MKILCLSLSLLVFSTSLLAQSNAEKLGMIKNLNRLAFGSCNKQNLKQHAWKDLIEQTPDLFLWGGDNVYANTNKPEKLLASYQMQNAVEDYKFFKTLTPIIGIWDDHDYGDNNTDGKFPIKQQSKTYALDFLEEPLMSQRRLRDGIYTSYTFGESGKKVKIILLDNRYFLNLEKEFPMLGKQQWDWLQDEVTNTDANLLLVVSGLSVLSPQNSTAEEWMDYEPEKNRLRDLLQSKKLPYMYLTGDKHFSSIFRKDKEIEFLSSGMTHNTKLPMRPYVRARYPNPVFVNNYGLIDFSWENTTPILTLTIRSVFGQNMIVKRVKWQTDTWLEM